MKRVMKRNNFTGYGKKFEQKVMEVLEQSGASFHFEGLKVSYTTFSTYKPDILLENGVVVEIKTFLPYDEQRKLRDVKASNPELDLRLLFEKPDKVLPNSKLTHAQWADKYGFKWAAGLIPLEWIGE